MQSSLPKGQRAILCTQQSKKRTENNTALPETALLTQVTGPQHVLLSGEQPAQRGLSQGAAASLDNNLTSESFEDSTV